MSEKPSSMSKQTEADDLVKLNPVMGIRPGVYLTALYSVILLLALFFLLVFPGLKKPGAVLVFATEPDGAAIRVDDVYMGVSSEKIFVPKGPHTIEAVIPGFQSGRADMEIPARVFGSLFFPLRVNVNFTLKAADPAGAFVPAAADFAAWSFGGEPTAAWQIPMSLSEGAYRAGPANDPQTAEILAAASRFAVTRAALRDLLRAKILLDNGGLSPSPAGMANSVSDILVFLSENPGSADWLSSLLPAESAAIVRASNWYKNELADIQPPPAAPASGSAARRLDLAGLVFTNIPAGILNNGSYAGPYNSFPRNTRIDSFMISENPVSKAVFEAFLNENPSWRDDIETQNGVFSPEITGRSETAGVSWFAAEAFCLWLTKRLPPSMADMEARLPTEAEWEYAAGTGIRSMQNTAWEWCADPFAPLLFISAPPKAVQITGSPERSLRSRGLGRESRASLPPEFSSPFQTFRPVIAAKSSGYSPTAPFSGSRTGEPPLN